MAKQQTTNTTGLWHRAARALGKLFAGMVSFPDDPRPAARRAAADAYPRFPAF
jgi:hypothetical protein